MPNAENKLKMTESEFSLDGPRYASRFGLEMPLIAEVQQHASALEQMAEATANRIARDLANGSLS